MIHYVKRSELDEQKYDACIRNALNTRIYAYSWYLDIVATNWDALVLNDYEVVMPLPWRRKYFIKYIYPPCWTQQLGLFSSQRIETELVQKFIKNIPKKFKKVTIQFNSDNPIAGKNVTDGVNYILSLDKPYEELKKVYNENRRRVLKTLSKFEFVIDKNIDCNDFLNFYLATKKKYELKSDQILCLKKLLKSKNKNVNIWGVRYKSNFIGGLVWLRDHERITYLLPITTQSAKEKGISTLFLDEIIKQFSNTSLVLDFEGSMIDGVSRFYGSFGAKEEKYYLFRKILIKNG